MKEKNILCELVEFYIVILSFVMAIYIKDNTLFLILVNSVN